MPLSNPLNSSLPFKPSNQPFGMHGAPACRYESKSSLTLRREDTLGRPLTITDGGSVTDHDGTSASAKITDAKEAHFKDLALGEAQWTWRPTVEGEHLIGVKTVSESRLFRPGEAMNEPLPLEIIQGRRKATTIHLPPPVMINLREDDAPDQLTEKQLDYFRSNGNNALIYIHGYNVDHGEWGRFLDGAKKVGRSQRPVAIWNRDTPATVWQDAENPDEENAPTLNPDDLNGSGAHNWAINMEYQLNRAAGFDGEGWMPYSRIINVSWPGNTGSTDFMQAEFNAMASGRRLVALFQQLQDAGVALNVITHSLGARVILTTLNILGTLQRPNGVDHLFLWEPAVADNALSNDASNDVHPLGLGVFPVAHKAVRQIVILHSRGDGVLGPQESEQRSLMQRAFALTPPGMALSATQTAWDIATADDPMDEFLALVHGAYNKKWWTFPSFLDNGLAPSIESLYSDYLPLTYNDAQPVGHAMHRAQQTRKREALDNWDRLERDILNEAKNLLEPCVECLRNAERPPTYRLLAPLNHKASVSIDMARRYIQQLRALAANNWYPTQKPRPAMGDVGFEKVVGDEAGEARDVFLEQISSPGGKIEIVDQTDWLFSHSGMRIPSQKLFEEVFLREIMEQRLLANSTFGQY